MEIGFKGILIRKLDSKFFLERIGHNPNKEIVNIVINQKFIK